MTLLKFPLNGTADTAITAANSGLMTVVAAGGGATATYRSGAAYQGATGAEFVATDTTAAYAQAQFSAPALVGAISIAFKIPSSIPAATKGFVTIYDTSNARVVSIQYTNDGRVFTQDKGNAVTVLMTAAQATAGTWFRFELVVTNLSATAGAFTARAYNSAGTQVGSTVSITAANLGVTAMSYARFGGLSAAAWVADLDSVQTNDGATTEIGQMVNVTNPVASATETDNIAIVDATGSSATNGGTLSYAISPSTGVTALASGIWKVVQQAGPVTYTITVTETYGGSSTVSATTTTTVGAAATAGATATYGTKVRTAGSWV